MTGKPEDDQGDASQAMAKQKHERNDSNDPAPATPAESKHFVKHKTTSSKDIVVVQRLALDLSWGLGWKLAVVVLVEQLF